MPASLTDTHAHLADPSLLPNVAELVAGAASVGVDHILAVGVDVPTSTTSVGLAEQFPIVWAAVGIHPHEASTCDRQSLEDIRRLASHPRVVAIGEIGLDYFRNLAPADVQRQAFVDQLGLAASLELPVVVHNRDATADVLRLIGDVSWPPGLAARAGVLHCFSDGEKTAGEAMRQGLMLSFAGNLTFRRAEDLREVAAMLPIDYVLTETDSPYLAPVPLRGKTNQPSNVRLVVDKLAEVRASSADVIATATSANARRLFRWD